MPKDLTLSEALDRLEAETAAIRAKAEYSGSRYVGAGADPDVAAHVAAGGSIKMGTAEPFDHGRAERHADFKTVQPGQGRGGAGGSLAKAIIDIAQHRTEGMTPVYAAKALAESTDTAGGFLLTAEIADSVFMLIRNRVAVLNMPVTRVTPRSKQYLLPGLAGGASAAWLTENAAIPASQETFALVGTMVPRPLGALVAVSNLLLRNAVAENPDAAGSADQVIRADLADLMAVTYDAGLLAGSGTIEPKGILSYASETTPLPAGVIGTNGSQVSYDLLVQIIGALQQASLPFGSPGWAFNGRTLTGLMSLTNSVGEPLLASAGLLTLDASGTTGRLLGFPFRTTNAIPNDLTQGSASNATAIIFASDWSELFVGQWAEFALDTSQEATYTTDGGTTWISAYQSQQTLMRATLWADMAIRRPAAFVIASGIVP